MHTGGLNLVCSKNIYGIRMLKVMGVKYGFRDIVGYCIDKLGVFYANQTSMCLDPHLN